MFCSPSLYTNLYNNNNNTWHYNICLNIYFVSLFKYGVLTAWSSASGGRWGLIRRSVAVRLQGSCVRIPLRAWIFVFCVHCVGTGACGELFTCSEESIGCACDLETVTVRGLRPEMWCCAPPPPLKKKPQLLLYFPPYFIPGGSSYYNYLYRPRWS
jgi:hypothetical protein